MARIYRWKCFGFIGLLLSAVSACAETPKPQAALACSISLAATQRLDDGVWLSFTLHNKQTNAIKVLTWYTAFEGFLSPLFSISDRDNNPLRYKGAMVKRLTPDASDYIEIAGNGSATAKLDLRQGYALNRGDYVLRLNKASIHYQDATGASKIFSCQLPAQTFHID